MIFLLRNVWIMLLPLRIHLRFWHNGEIPESEICRECNIEIVDGLGAKIQASSDLRKGVK